jgi:hypothetical protein
MSLNLARQPIEPFKLLSESISQVAPTYLSLLLINVPSVFINLLPQLMPLVTALVATYAYLLLVSPVIGAIGMCFIHRYLKHQTIDLAGSVSQALSKSFPLIIGMIIFTLSGAVGLILLVIPGIYLVVVLGFCLYAIAIDNYSVMDGFKYSFKLVKGRWWQVLGSMLAGSLLILPAIIINIAIAPKAPDFGTTNAIIATLISSILAILFTPLLQMYYVKLYLRLQDTDNLSAADGKFS